jgi:hypothetical protein
MMISYYTAMMNASQIRKQEQRNAQGHEVCSKHHHETKAMRPVGESHTAKDTENATI